MNHELQRAMRKLTTAVTEARRKADLAPQLRQGEIVAVNAGPPKSLDVKVPSGDKTGYTTLPKVRYIDLGAAVTYAVGNTVWLYSLGRGRWIVAGRLA